MDKVLIHQIAKELGIKSKEVIQKAGELGIVVKSPSSGVSVEDAEKIYEYIVGKQDKPAPKKQQPPKEEKKEQKDVETTKEVKEVAREVKKPRTERKKEIKKEPKKSDKKVRKEELFSARKRGLVIVKKKRQQQPQPKKTEEEVKEVSESLELKRKGKKHKKSTQPAKKHEGKKIEILEDRELKDVSLELEEEMVVLPDFSEELGKLEKKEEETPKKTAQKQVKVARKSFTIEPQSLSRGSKKKKRKKKEVKKEEVKVVELPEEVRVYEFAEKAGKSVGDVIKVLFNLGTMATKNDFLDKDTIELLADEFGLEVKIKDVLEELDYVKAYDAIEDTYLEERPPVITIMGHVDHGKTSLLDYIRNSRIAEKEAGGITQHIGAYMVERGGKKITFIDTPGHEAFTQMRARGAQATDIAVIVVAADDGVKPQTIEAINHAKNADVPMIIAINKIDKPEANPTLVKTQLSELGITPSEWGGDYEFVEVSAKTGEGVDDLLDTILLQAELMELKANPKREAKAIVIESSLEKGRGPVATDGDS